MTLMNVVGFTIQISSSDPEALKAFYKDVVGLQVDDVVGGFKIGDGHLLIDAHDQIDGPNTQPARFLVNFFVADIDAEQARLEAQGVTFIRDKGHEYWGGIISTFLDPDGNYAQLIEFRPND